jgi:VanZ family protein
MSRDDLREKPKLGYRIAATVGAVAWAALIFALSAVPGESYPPHPGFLNVVAHFCEYAILAVLLVVSLHGPKRKLWLSAVIAIAVASLYGSSDELHQYFVPGRDSSPLDWLADSIGALAGAIAAIFVISLKAVKRSREKDARTGQR